MIKDSLLRQIVALRASMIANLGQVDAVLAAIEEVEPKPVAPVGCQHPEKSRVIFGRDDEFECRKCGYRSPELVAGG